MKALSLVLLTDPDVVPEKTKIHLACDNGRDDPLNLYRAGTFAEWQRWQSRKNFERPFVVSLIQMPKSGEWLFAGAYSSLGSNPDDGGFIYQLEQRPATKALDGRLIVDFERPSRQSYLKAERWIDQLLVAEIRAERLSVPDFPGFKGLHISKAQLDLVVRENHGAWKAALSSVAGVYLIADSVTGKFYVGSATGEGGIWQRWVDYSLTGHGGNRDLKLMLGAANALKRAGALQFSILEIADTHTSEAEVRARESHWKRVLLTRIHGLNAN